MAMNLETCPVAEAVTELRKSYRSVDLRTALINVLTRIDALERRLATPQVYPEIAGRPFVPVTPERKQQKELEA